MSLAACYQSLGNFEDAVSTIQKILDINYPINSDPNLFDWYCNIRNKLAKKIHDKKLVATILQKSKP